MIFVASGVTPQLERKIISTGGYSLLGPLTDYVRSWPILLQKSVETGPEA